MFRPHRHNREETETRQRNDTQFYSAMTWHWLRIKKSRRTHKGVLTVLMDDADLGAVMSCDGQVAPQVTRLLTTSSFA